jgi:hypothetical protein
MVLQEEERKAQEKSLTCLASLKEQFKDSVLEVFLFSDEEKANMEKMLRDVWFFGPNNSIDLQKDGLVFCLNEAGEPCLFFMEDVEKFGHSDDTSKIGIVGNSVTDELDFFVSNPDWRFDKRKDGASELSKTPEGIALADYMVDIVEAQLEAVAEV